MPLKQVAGSLDIPFDQLRREVEPAVPTPTSPSSKASAPASTDRHRFGADRPDRGARRARRGPDRQLRPGLRRHPVPAVGRWPRRGRAGAGGFGCSRWNARAAGSTRRCDNRATRPRGPTVALAASAAQAPPSRDRCSRRCSAGRPGSWRRAGRSRNRVPHQGRDVAGQVAAAEHPLPGGLDPGLPAGHGGVGRAAMLAEQQLAAGPEHAARLAQGGGDIWNGAEREGTSTVSTLRSSSETARRLPPARSPGRATRPPAVAPWPHGRLRLQAVDPADLGRIVERQVQARAQAELEHHAARARHDRPAQIAVIGRQPQPQLMIVGRTWRA